MKMKLPERLERDGKYHNHGPFFSGLMTCSAIFAVLFIDSKEFKKSNYFVF